jgi:hypothetical protein
MPRPNRSNLVWGILDSGCGELGTAQAARRSVPTIVISVAEQPANNADVQDISTRSRTE